MIALTLSGLFQEVAEHDGSSRPCTGRIEADSVRFPMLSAVVHLGATLCEHVETSPGRRKLPDTRSSITHKVKIDTEQGPMSVYFTVGFFEDGSPAEVFINAGKIGSTVRGLLNDLARLLSFALQYGVPAEEVFERMMGSNYAPQGSTSNADLPACKSITDYMFRWLHTVKREGA